MKVRAVFCGSLRSGETSAMRYAAMKRAGLALTVVNTDADLGLPKRIISAVAKRIGHGIDWGGLNQRLLNAVISQRPQVVWIDKGVFISGDTLQSIRSHEPRSKIVHYSLDDMSGRHNRSRQYVSAIPYYDLHVTTKSFGVAELRQEGARDVILLDNAFCPEIHQPRQVSDREREELGGPVGFIGTFERDRAEALSWIASKGIPVRVWGDGWASWSRQNRQELLRIENNNVRGERYAKAICSFDINLGFLRRLNRDLQTTRSVEIPACGAFLLAERTREHLKLFEEGKEAEYFDSEEELLQKCRYYLENPLKRRDIARNGRLKCESSDYSYDSHITTALRHLRVTL